MSDRGPDRVKSVIGNILEKFLDEATPAKSIALDTPEAAELGADVAAAAK